MTTKPIEVELAPSKIKKRDGRIVEFDKAKIAEAIWKAARSVGGRDRATADRLADQVVNLLVEKYGVEHIPTVEEVQDLVEKVLIENGHARTAKAYILYRQKRTELREEKKRILEKEEIDEVDKFFDTNALRVLKARYLRRDPQGRLLETPKQLFQRVAIHVALGDLINDPLIAEPKGGQPIHEEEAFDPSEYEGRIRLGEYVLNRYHLLALKRIYDRANKRGRMKVSWRELLRLIQEGAFQHIVERIEEYYQLMVSKRFLPNTPALANFGNPLGMGSACFVLDIEDSMESIMETLKNTAMIFKAGGGLGYNFSKLRPEGDFVSTTYGTASGPISFMRLFDTMTEVIKQGGIRRGANMGILNINHPDIEKFIKAKAGNQALRNFNISVLILPDFWSYYEKNEPYPLINPRNGEVVKHVNPRALFDLLAYQAWESAEPGVIFYDRVNEYNPLYEHLGPIVTTNPCGEVLLYPYESCNLGSINVWAFVKEEDGPKIDWDGLREAVRIAVRFLDNVIEVNNYPLQKIEEMTLATRKIGLGIMGVADLLFELGIPYDSEEGRSLMEKLMEFINYYSKRASIELAQERGPFPLFDKSFYPKGRLPFCGYERGSRWGFDWQGLINEIKLKGLRNAYTTVIAPTGSISMIAGCSSGIEPAYRLVFEKHVKIGSFYYINPVFEKVIDRLGLDKEQLMREVCEQNGSVKNIPGIPDEVKRVFVTAMDIKPEDHIMVLAAFQRWTDSSISKTNNFPANASVEDVKKAYLLAYKLGCKDVTVFRDTSIQDQVLVPPKLIQRPKEEVSEADYSPKRGFSKAAQAEDICRSCGARLERKEGCLTCPECGWSVCN